MSVHCASRMRALTLCVFPARYFFLLACSLSSLLFSADIPCSDNAKDLMSRLLTQDTAKRLTASEALDHPWMTGGASKTPLLRTVMNNLKDFTATSKFKTGILKIMADSMTEKELNDLKEVFKTLDADGDGKVTVTELSTAMEKAGTSARKEELLALLQSADVDGDGTLSYEVRGCTHPRIAAILTIHPCV